MNAAASRPPIDVIVPVYNAPDDVRSCIDSVLANTAGDYRLILIDDASPDPRIGALLDSIARLGAVNVVVLRNERNMGFTATANRGMTETRADIVLLNSDTIVTSDWLAALARCAASDKRIATVTPFSNNAEICSFPRMCANNPVAADREAEAIRDALAGAAVPTYPDLPTGVGFCMLIRRAALDALGPFDMAFGAGYGEENDFCVRAANAGWRNVLADDAFVVHTGGRSFAGRKDDLGVRNMDVLLRRHPHYLPMVQAYIAADPLRPLREAAQSRLAAATALPGVLHVIHDHGGGTETYVRTLIDASRERWRHFVATAVGDRWQVEEHAGDATVRSFEFVREAGEDWRAFVGGIAASFGVSLIHVHHASRSRDGILAALASLGLPYGITIHDSWLACPTVMLTRADGRFCGGVTDVDVCTRCLDAQPPFAGTDILQWRREHAALVAGAAFLIAPSRWSAATLSRYFPHATTRIDVIEHGAADIRNRTAADRPTTAVLLPGDDVPVVTIVGAIGRGKGARRIERLAELARERGETLRFVVIGYLDTQYASWQSTDAMLTIHGRYATHELPALFTHYRSAVVVYPAEGPESFSYTLSEAWRAGLPALVPPIGALAERVGRAGAGWVMTDEEWTDDARMLDRIVELLDARCTAAYAAAVAKARAAHQPSGAEMADATSALYASALAARKSLDLPEFDRRRIRDALHYVDWKPPSAEHIGEPPGHPGDTTASRSPGFVNTVARWALSKRRTPMGRILYRAAPAPLIDALKARLDG